MQAGRVPGRVGQAADEGLGRRDAAVDAPMEGPRVLVPILLDGQDACRVSRRPAEGDGLGDAIRPCGQEPLELVEPVDGELGEVGPHLPSLPALARLGVGAGQAGMGTAGGVGRQAYADGLHPRERSRGFVGHADSEPRRAMACW